MTASNAAVINRLVHLARTGTCAVAGVNGPERPEFADMPHAVRARKVVDLNEPE